jgi:hypothetical protein
MRRLTIALDEADEANLHLTRDRYRLRSDAAAIRFALRVAATARTIDIADDRRTPRPPNAPAAKWSDQDA